MNVVNIGLNYFYFAPVLVAEDLDAMRSSVFTAMRLANKTFFCSTRNCIKAQTNRNSYKLPNTTSTDKAKLSARWWRCWWEKQLIITCTEKTGWYLSPFAVLQRVCLAWEPQIWDRRLVMFAIFSPIRTRCLKTSLKSRTVYAASLFRDVCWINCVTLHKPKLQDTSGCDFSDFSFSLSHSHPTLYRPIVSINLNHKLLQHALNWEPSSTNGIIATALMIYGGVKEYDSIRGYRRLRILIYLCKLLGVPAFEDTPLWGHREV